MDLKTTEANLRQEIARTILLSREVLEDIRRKYGMHEPPHPRRTFDHEIVPSVPGARGRRYPRNPPQSESPHRDPAPWP